MWTAGSVWIAPLEGTRWRPYGESTDSRKSRGLVMSATVPGREQWRRKPGLNGGVESAIRTAKRWFRSPRHTWSGRAGAHLVFDIPGVRSGAVKSDLQLDCGQPFDDHHRASAVRPAPCRLRRLCLRYGNIGDGEQLAAQRQRCRALAIGQKAEAADAHEASRQKMLQEAQKGDVVLMTGDSRDRIRALVKLDRYFDSYLYVGRMVDASVLAHMHTTEDAVKEYTTLQGRKTQLQVSVTAMFIAVALLLLLAAVWFALVFAEQLVTPISALILAAERVRRGDLSVRVPESANDDEIGLLGRAFNRMTRQIEEQRDELIAANRMLDERRRFTEAVLSGASSGVIGLNAGGFITLANSRAAEVLVGDTHHDFAGARLIDFIPEAVDLLQKAHQTPDKPAALQLEFAAGDGPRKTVFLRITAEQGGPGAVATIDDITALISAQKKSAWADVARRIAHEIKNPLTPIQLSAERLKRKYLPQIHDDPETFEKCTDTIVRQVNDIGRMVGEFSAYARMPNAMKQVENIVDVCQDTLVLQKQAHPDIRFGFISAEPVIRANCDRSQLTQVITNLLQNAIDSVHERQQHDASRPKYISGASAPPGEGNVRMAVEQRGENIIISVEDNGLGLPEKGRDQLLEPYVTTKKKGSGLGLAIVKKIMEDHEGSVVLEDSVLQDTESGAKATIVFPRDVKS